MRMTLLKLSALTALSALALVGCTDSRIADAQSKMAQIRNEPARPIDPVPEPEPVEPFIYSAADVRSPFLAPSLLNMQAQLEQNMGIKPDINRKKEPLESFELSQLIYRGKVVANGREYGLVQLPDGFVKEVQVGEYMGKNDGRILEITPTQINLEEIVPDSRSGFTYKKTPLITPN